MRLFRTLPLIMSQHLRIALVHHKDARDVRSWSGTLFFQKNAIERFLGDVVDVTPVPFPLRPYRAGAWFGRTVSRKAWPYDQSAHLARRAGSYFTKLLRDNPCDLIFSPGGSASLSFLETDIPIIYYSDATWRVVEDYYSDYSNVIPFLSRSGELLEQRTIDKSSLLVYPSTWAAESAIRDYGADPANVHVLYLGANLMNPPRRADVLPRSLGKTLRLLLVGVNWKIKGGSVALEVLERLLALGYDAQLTVVGCTAPEGVSHPRMEVIPFLNKQVPEERERFERAWHEADFFVLPSRFEAAGLVFCEASAHGLPILAARTGGIPSLVVEGKNGFTIPHGAEPEGYVEKIVALVSDPAGYAELCERSRGEYEERLNWDAWGSRLAEVVVERFPQFRERIEERRDALRREL